MHFFYLNRSKDQEIDLISEEELKQELEKMKVGVCVGLYHTVVKYSISCYIMFLLHLCTWWDFWLIFVCIIGHYEKLSFILYHQGWEAFWGSSQAYVGPAWLGTKRKKKVNLNDVYLFEILHVVSVEKEIWK